MEDDLGKQIGNHIGCMAGFFNIFDRPNLLSPKRFSLPKRLSSSPNTESQPASETSSPLLSKDLGNRKQDSRYSTPQLRSPAPESLSAAPDGNMTRSPLTLPVIEFKEGSRSPWRFSKEAPRLSLDSRAVVDAKGSLKPRQIRKEASGIPPMNRRDTTEGENQRGSPSVIARLMGLEPLSSADSEQPQKSALKRSASESRVSSREYRFADSFNFQAQRSQNQQYSNSRNLLRDETVSTGDEVPVEFHLRSSRAQPARAPPQQRYVARRTSFFDSTDFFPDPKQCGLAHGDNEKVTKINGFDEPPSDLETLKQLLEALKLKGLLHSSNKQQNGIRNRNLVFDHHESPIKLASLPTHLHQSRDSSLIGIRSGAGARAVAAAASPSANPRLDRGTANRSYARDHSKVRIGVSPKRSDNSVKSPNRRPMLKEMPEQLMRVSPVTWRIPEPVQTGNHANRCEATEEQCSMASRNNTVGSQTEEEIWKVKEYNREGKTLLERCDKLLNSIAEMTATAAAEAGESQPSPVSVLDPSLYHEDSSPSPVMKRTLDFTEQPMESEDDAWGGSMVSISPSSDESEYAYIFDILRASDCLPEDSDIFSLLEKQQYVRGKCASRAATQERRLIFDTVQEIVGRRKKLPPWRTVQQASLQVIWSEYRKIRKKRWSESESEEEEEDLVGFVCGVLGRDLREKEWRDCEVEMSEAVLDIERLIFKDLIGETIGEVAAGVKRSEWGLQLQLQLQLRRRLVF